MRLVGNRFGRVLACCLPAALLFSMAGQARAGSCEVSANYGVFYTPSDVINSVKALPPEALSGKKGKGLKSPPKSAQLTNLPPVAQQGTTADPGSPGTCEALAYGYGLGTYTAARTSAGTQKWPANLAQNETSAAYLYALIQKRAKRECPEGSRSLDYLEQLVAGGSPSRVQVNYQPNCTYLNNINTNPLPNMARLRIGSYAVIPVDGNPGAVDQIKSQLNAGQAVAFTGPVLCGYAKQPSFKRGVIYDTATVPNSGLGQLIVGYDNKLGGDKQPGAFLVQNGFGTSWPPAGSGSIAPPGQVYWSYDTFAATQVLAAVAYPVADELGSIRLLASDATAPAATVTGSYQWAPRGDDQSVYLIVRLAVAGPVQLNEVWLTEPSGAKTQVRAVYGQSLSAGYVYLKRTDGKSFLGGKYKFILKATLPDSVPVTYSGNVKVNKLKKAGTLVPAGMLGANVTGPTGALVLTD
jgi:hypothetical protein